MTSLEKKIVLITGASSGIGRSCAEVFAEAGANLILLARRNDRLTTLVSELTKKYGILTLADKLDVRDQASIAQFFEKLPVEWRDIDILINNAGLSRGLDKLYQGNLRDWEEMIDTNIKGLLYMSRSVIPGMVERKK